MIIERFKTLASRETQIDWIVEGLLTSGEWTYFVGEAGSGKSMLMIQLCNALQSGDLFLNMVCKRRNCLYIQVDTGRLEWQDQVARLAKDSLAWTMYAVKDNFLDDPEELEVIKNVIWGSYPEDTQLYRVLKGIPFNFIVFDVLNRMTAVDLNSKSGMSHVLSKLAYLTTTRGGEEDNIKESVHYILVHHPNKSVKRGVNAGSGYGGFGGLCGNMLTLGGNLLVLEKSKVIGKKEILLERARNGAWYVPERMVSVDNEAYTDQAFSKADVTRSILGL